MRGVFVTGTDTDVGKSVVAAAICAAAVDRGLSAPAFKPVVTGLNEASDEWPPDHELLAGVANAGQSPDEVAPYRFGPAVSPHLAGELSGEEVDPERFVGAAEAQAERADAIVVEGVGGLLVPLARDYLVRDFAAELSLPVVIAARPGLGTINHTLMTIECARAAGLHVAAVVFTPWRRFPRAIERSNRSTIEALGHVETFGLSKVEIANGLGAVRTLPAERWVGEAARAAA